MDRTHAERQARYREREKADRRILSDVVVGLWLTGTQRAPLEMPREAWEAFIAREEARRTRREKAHFLNYDDEGHVVPPN